MEIKIGDHQGLYPKSENGGLLGDIVNERWQQLWIRSNNPQFESFDSMAISVLIEDYNERHKELATPEIEENK